MGATQGARGYVAPAHDVRKADNGTALADCRVRPWTSLLTAGKPPVKCEGCGKMLTLFWDVRVIETEAR